MMFLYVAFCKPKSFVQLLPHFWFLYLYVPLMKFALHLHDFVNQLCDINGAIM